MISRQCEEGNTHKESTAIGQASAGRAVGRFVGTVGPSLAQLRFLSLPNTDGGSTLLQYYDYEISRLRQLLVYKSYS